MIFNHRIIGFSLLHFLLLIVILGDADLTLSEAAEILKDSFQPVLGEIKQVLWELDALLRELVVGAVTESNESRLKKATAMVELNAMMSE